MALGKSTLGGLITVSELAFQPWAWVQQEYCSKSMTFLRMAKLHLSQDPASLMRADILERNLTSRADFWLRRLRDHTMLDVLNSSDARELTLMRSLPLGALRSLRRHPDTATLAEDVQHSGAYGRSATFRASGGVALGASSACQEQCHSYRCTYPQILSTCTSTAQGSSRQLNSLKQLQVLWQRCLTGILTNFFTPFSKEF